MMSSYLAAGAQAVPILGEAKILIGLYLRAVRVAAWPVLVRL